MFWNLTTGPLLAGLNRVFFRRLVHLPAPKLSTWTTMGRGRIMVVTCDRLCVRWLMKHLFPLVRLCASVLTPDCVVGLRNLLKWARVSGRISMVPAIMNLTWVSFILLEGSYY